MKLLFRLSLWFFFLLFVSFPSLIFISPFSLSHSPSSPFPLSLSSSSSVPSLPLLLVPRVAWRMLQRPHPPVAPPSFFFRPVWLVFLLFSLSLDLLYFLVPHLYFLCFLTDKCQFTYGPFLLFTCLREASLSSPSVVLFQVVFSCMCFGKKV